MPAVILAAWDNPLKAALLLAVCAVLMLLGRWSSRLSGSRSENYSTDFPALETSSLLPTAGSSPKIWPPSAEEIAASLPFDPALGRLRIRKLYFNNADVVPGPDNPEVFADELHIETYDPESDHAWWQSYFIATPQGLAKLLREKSWRYVHAPNILVFPRYNLEETRRAVVSRIMADHDYFKGEQQEEEESL